MQIRQIQPTLAMEKQPVIEDWMHVERWEPVTPRKTCGTLPGRTPEIYEAIIDQFNVENAPRYKPGNGATYCNIFVWDVTRALCCEIPHWKGPRELTANNLVDWLDGPGNEHGWYKVSDVMAGMSAERGSPTIAVARNLKGHGHIAMLVPAHNQPGLWVAQAGLKCARRMPLATAFGSLKYTCYTHA